MTKKARSRLNRSLAHLRQAHDLLGGIGLADGLPVFDGCRLIRANLADLITQMAPMPNPTAPPSPKQ